MAVLGSVLAAAYRSHLPVRVPEGARRSLGEAPVAAREAGPAGSGLAAAARTAFDVAMHHSLLVGAGVAVLGAVVGWRFIGTGQVRDRSKEVAEPADDAVEAVPVA